MRCYSARRGAGGGGPGARRRTAGATGAIGVRALGGAIWAGARAPVPEGSAARPEAED